MLILFFLMTSVIACSLTDRFQKQIIISKKNEGISKQLYSLSERLLNVSGIEYILLKGNQYIEESIQIKTNISLEIKEESKNVIPIIGMNRVLGSIEILSHQGLNEDQMIIIKAAANQLGNALERELTYLEQEKIKVAMEREHMLNSMLRSISHDLRTPLTGIVGASQLMMNQDHLTNEDVYSLAKDIHDQAHWLTQIVENILNMSKIESGNLVLHKNLEVVDDLIYEAIQHLPELEKRNVQVDVPEDLLLVNVDGKLMVQVLINILNNAIKYTKENDRIDIQVRNIDRQVQFTIKDEGKGISKKIVDHIFEEFVTDTNVSNDSQKGIGLGLAICKAIIQAHGGKIWAKDETDGACFIFTIPSDKELNV
jgi:two-component system sensor histidine kinase KdpD